MYVSKYDLFLQCLIQFSFFIVAVISVIFMIKYIKKSYMQSDIIANDIKDINKKEVEIASLKANQGGNSNPIIVIDYTNDHARKNLFDVLNSTGYNVSKEQQKIIEKSLLSHYKEMGFRKE